MKAGLKQSRKSVSLNLKKSEPELDKVNAMVCTRV